MIKFLIFIFLFISCVDKGYIESEYTGISTETSSVQVQSFLKPADATYSDNGGSLLFQMNFSGNVIVSGTPRLKVKVGNSIVSAIYSSGSASSSLEFSYTVQAGDNDLNGIEISSSSIELNGGQIIGVIDNFNIDLNFSTYVNSMTGVIINTSSGINPPDQVIGVVTSPTTSNTELALAWSRPNDNGTTIIKYSLQYRQQGDTVWISLLPYPITNSATIVGLSSGIMYEVRVAADNGIIGSYSPTTTAENFDISSLLPVAWLSSTDITNGGLEPSHNDKIFQWEDLSGTASAATEASVAKQPTYETNVQNGLPAARFSNLDRGLEGTFNRTVGTDLTFVVVGQFDTGSNDKCLFEFQGGGASRGFFIDKRYASNTNYSPILTKGNFNLWRIEDIGGFATITENSITTLFSNNTSFNTDFTGAGTYVLGDDASGGNRLAGYIGEFLIFDKALSATEIQKLEDYLKNKWGL